MTLGLPNHLQRILDLFDPKPRRVENGWSARCPLHDDRESSLGITVSERERRRVNLKCHRGCDGDELLVALGLAVADLYPDRTRKGLAPPLREFLYVDRDGVVLYKVFRLAKGGFRYKHPGVEGWEWGLGGAAKVLYRLPLLLANPDLAVWITEGERDADSLAQACGLLTTTVASGDWAVDTTPLAGRPKVFVVVDNDRAGWTRGLATCEAARAAGATYIEVMRPPDRFKDVTEMLAEGRDCADLIDSVNLHLDYPPIEQWNPPAATAPIVDRDGNAFGVRTPAPLFLALIDAGKLEPIDPTIWLVYENRSGASGIAHLTAAEAGRLTTLHPREAQRSVDRLVNIGLLARTPNRKRMRVLNPAWPQRRGDVNLDLTYRRSATQPDTTPKASTYPHYVPKEATGESHQPRESVASTFGEATRESHQPPKGDPIEATDEAPPSDDPTPEADAIRRALDTFPGSTLIDREPNTTRRTHT